MAAKQRKTRAYVAKVEAVEVRIGPEMDRTVYDLIRSVAGEVIDAVEAIVKESRDSAYSQWYDNVTKVTGDSQAGLKYKMVIRGDSIVGVVFNDATKAAKRRVGGRLEVAQEKYGYFVHRPRAFSKVARSVPMPEYRLLMSHFRRFGGLPEGYVAARMTDSLGRRRPVGLAKIEPNPKAGDGKRLWQALVITPSKKITEKHVAKLDTALTAVGNRIAR
jgi:uncharacterized protein YbjQ (UPF0145 family)